MSSDGVAIRVRGVSKRYELYESPRDRLKQFVLPRLRRMARLEPRNYFREFWALRDIDFDIRRGETVGIVGRNGSGKSTLLQIICGTLAPTEGTVEANGRIAALLELGSGFNPEFTGRENVHMNWAVLGLGKDALDACFDEIAAFADIGGFIDQAVKTYSSGMVVRLAFAVAIHSSPQILVVDEALSVGDELFQRKCFSRIERIKRAGATILFVSHSGGTVIDLCDRAILLDAGEKLNDDTPKLVVGRYQKLMYAAPEKAQAVRDAIRQSLGPPREEDGESGASDTSVRDIEEFYDPGLVPASTIVYEPRGAVIESARITNLSGTPINCLISGRRYIYSFDVRFLAGVTSVRFGMLLKTVSGVELGGGLSSSSLHGAVPYIEPNARMTVNFSFLCSLNPGVYFVNAGVVGSEGMEEIFLHRLLDACMFRVLPSSGSLSSGVVDFSCAPEIFITDGEKGRFL